jgi:AcrR family transcriptional regulator
MAGKTRTPARREDALSRERIVDAAVVMLDATGESGLTFRALSAELKTGPGAIYWHVANKSELLVAATGAVLAPVMVAEGEGATPQEAIRATALAVFDAIDRHPWIGSELSRTPGSPPLLQLFERIGRPVQALGVPVVAQFAVASALVNYILGVGGQNAATTRAYEGEATRPEFLGTVAGRWAQLDPARFPFLRSIASQLPGHDDRVVFLDGVDLILAGIAGLWPPATGD